jgi:ribosomal protein S12
MKTKTINWRDRAFEIILEARKAREDIARGAIYEARDKLIRLYEINEKYHNIFLRSCAMGKLTEKEEVSAYIRLINNTLDACGTELDEIVTASSHFYRGHVN